MDSQESQKEQHVHYHYRRRGIFAGLIGLVLLVIVFCVGLAAGSRFAFHRYGYGFDGMMGFNRQAGFNHMGMMGSYGFQNNRVFGTITGISGNKIAINNNGAQSQTVLTQANTAIISATGTQMALADLKTGDKISVVGTTDQNNQITAAVINVEQ